MDPFLTRLWSIEDSVVASMGQDPQKITFRYYSEGVMLPYIFINCYYSCFILCMMAVLTEQLE